MSDRLYLRGKSTGWWIGKGARRGLVLFFLYRFFTFIGVLIGRCCVVGSIVASHGEEII